MKWYNPQTKPFEINGFAFYDQDMLYRRLPLNPCAQLPEAVYYLGDETSGGQIRFHCRCKQLKIQVSIASRKRYFSQYTSPHLTETNKKAFDLYISMNGGKYEYVTTPTNYSADDIYYENTLLNLTEEAEFDALLYFPLYGGIDKILIGIDDDGEITKTRKPFANDGRIIFYGTSIEEGACASRPGMSCSNILSRFLDCEVLNMGFDASGKGEAEVARMFCCIENVKALILATDANSPDGQWMCDKLPEFIRIFREKNPDALIVMVPFIESGRYRLFPERHKTVEEKLEAQKQIVSDLTAAGDKNICLYIHENMDSDAFADGVHGTDIAFMEEAKGLYEVLKNIIK